MTAEKRTFDRFQLRAYHLAAREAALDPTSGAMSEDEAAALLDELVGAKVGLPDKRYENAEGHIRLERGARVAALQITTNEPFEDYQKRLGAPGRVTFGTTDNPKASTYNRLEPVAKIEVREGSKIVEWDDGKIERVATKTYLAHGANYTLADGTVTHDTVTSGPEHFAKDPNTGKVEQFGAATALLARLLEPFA